MLLGVFVVGLVVIDVQSLKVTGRFAYIKVVSPTQPKLFRLHGLSRFAYTKYLSKN